MRWLLILSLLLLPACYHRMAVTNEAFVWEWSVLNLRNGIKLGAAADVYTLQINAPISEDAAEMIPEACGKIVEGIVKGACSLP